MMKRSLRQTKTTVASVAEIKKLNPLIDRESRVFPYVYHLVAEDIKQNPDAIDWKQVNQLNFSDDHIKLEDYPGTRTVSIDNKDWEAVKNHFQTQSGVKVIQFPYLTKLCLLYARKKLRNMKQREIKKVEPNVMPREINENDLLFILDRVTTLFKRNDDEAQQIIEQIKTILQGEM